VPVNTIARGALIEDHGAAGYGIYWHLVELLHSEPSGVLPLKGYVYKAVAGKLKAEAKTVEKIVRQCIDEYDLFFELETGFTSNRVKKNKQHKAEIREIRRESGSKGGKQKASKSLANGSKPVANAKQSLAEERRGEEISIDISSSISLLQDSIVGTPTVESLYRAFSASYPRAVIGKDQERVKAIFESFELEKAKGVIEAFVLDLQNSGAKAEFFNDVIQYLEQ
jgi:hypothetical protein